MKCDAHGHVQRKPVCSEREGPQTREGVERQKWVPGSHHPRCPGCQSVRDRALSTNSSWTQARFELKFLSFTPKRSLVGSVVKNPPANAGDRRDRGSIPGQEDALEEGMETDSSILAWRFPWTECLVGYSLWVAKSRTWPKQLCMQAHCTTGCYTTTQKTKPLKYCITWMNVTCIVLIPTYYRIPFPWLPAKAKL